MDDDKFRLIVDGKELASIVPSLEEHDVPVGGSVRCRDTSGAVSVTMQASGAQFGGSSLTVRDGGIFVSSAEGKGRVAIHSGERLENEDSGVVKLTAGDGWKIVLNASKHSVEISAADETKIITLDAVSPDTILVRDGGGRTVLSFKRTNAALYVGAAGNEGDVVLFDNTGTQRIHLNGGAGQILLRNTGGEDRIYLNGGAGEIVARGAGGADRVLLLGLVGDIVAKRANGNDVFKFTSLDARLRVGGAGQAGSVDVLDATERVTLTLDGAKGDIVLENADCAEEFDIADEEGVESGMVMVIDDALKLRASRDPYDRRVAGVLAGAGDCRSGIILGRSASNHMRHPVALMGKTYCRVDARSAPVALGDLLTTSATRGHAMKAVDSSRAFGAVIGKALASLGSGTGLIPMLVALQ
jgi:hypothetical protein